MSQSQIAFRAEREADWQRLESLVTRAEKGALRKLPPQDVLQLPLLYRAALSSLAVARETSLDKALTDYLESLCARAFFVVHGRRQPLGAWTRQFFGSDLPAAMRAIAGETLVATLVLVLGIIAGYALVAGDITWYSALVPDAMAGGRDASASAASLKKTLYSTGSQNNGLEVFAAFLFSNNSAVAIFTFALGFAFGVPTILLLLYNGAMAGALIALFVRAGLGFELGGWLLIHGTTELFAIVLAGGAGLSLGRAMVFPGRMARLAALSRAGRTAGTAMMGVVLMLMVAALLEGFGRQLIVIDSVRYGVAAIMFGLWCLYFYGVRDE
ncbi:stage II sporulation protein M [Sandarakinorhabdus sp.]|uniref:stage II sporulation protein M n=1 Tax=Sandarakinorhabdus sp. TaxID=1916663 RepID=UPI00286DA1E6|nr:stage II sporulation protein M [Sandarakinorhabdus sp.]